jgi:very-short-patch-repair endonuclease
MANEPSKASNYWTESTVRRISELAERQHGVVALRQLRELGLSASAARSQVGVGRLQRTYRGVFAFGHRKLTPRGRWMAAVLACGPGAVLSHGAAGAALGIRRSASARIEVIAPRRCRIGGIHVHEGALVLTEVTTVDGIPCTTVARTLLDLASVIDRQALEKAINQAEILRLFDLRAVNATLERAGRRRGTRALRETLANLDPLSAKTRNDLERTFLRRCRESGLPLPEVNAVLSIEGESFEPDFLWRHHRLIVETDGWATHSTRRAFERDRRRDLLFLRAGLRTVRVTWRQVFDAWHEVVGALRPLLA